MRTSDCARRSKALPRTSMAHRRKVRRQLNIGSRLANRKDRCGTDTLVCAGSRHDEGCKPLQQAAPAGAQTRVSVPHRPRLAAQGMANNEVAEVRTSCKKCRLNSR